MFFFIRKFLPLLILPLGIVTFLLIINVFKKSRIISLIGLLILWIPSTGIFSNSLVKYIEKPWERLDPNNVPIADAIVVLNNNGIFEIGNHKITEWQDPDRFLGGISLFKSNKAPKLIFTNAKTRFGGDSGDIYIKEALKRGIPRSSLLKSKLVQTTAEEAIALRNLSEYYEDSDLKFKNIHLVTSAYHMKRAKRLFEKEGFNVYPYPVDFKGKIEKTINFKDPYHFLPNSQALKSSTIILREIMGNLFYKIKS